MTFKVIFCQGLGESVSNLFLGVDGEYFDEPLLHMFTKMMTAYIDVLGPKAKFEKPCQFKGTRVVFKDFALYIGLSANNLKISPPHFLQQPHERNDIT
jgi:hypothetical protein